MAKGNLGVIMNKKKWFEIKNSAGEVTIFIYDEISDWGMTAKDFVDQFKKIKADKITLRINSPGGDVFDGLAIYNLLRSSGKEIEVIIDGMAASIASVIAMAGTTIKMSNSAMLMIHNPWNWMGGESDDFRKMADILDQIRDIIANSYVERTGKPIDEIISLMKDETWMDANKAKELGFIDEVITITKTKNQITDNDKEVKLNDKLKAVLGVQTDEEAEVKIKEMQDKEAKNAEELQKMKVEAAVTAGKILPGQKAFALNLLKQDDKLYDSFIEQNKGVKDLTKTEPLAEKPETSMKMDDLLNDPAAYCKLREENPRAAIELAEAYMMNSGGA
jgi:ATP-dependent Clp endopeptidase proteolytic subunit ClpP